MMKDEFLARLKELLNDLPQEEREEAVRYYEDYFADAGPLEETRVLRELISPEDVAEKIRAGCGGREKAGEGDTFVEHILEERSDAAGAQGGSGNQDKSGMPENLQSQKDDEALRRQEEKNSARGQEEAWTQNSAGVREEAWTQNSDGVREEAWTQNCARGQEEAWTQDGARGQEDAWDPNRMGAQAERFTQEDANAREQRMRMGETYAQDYEDGAGYAQAGGRQSRTGWRGADAYAHGASMRTKSYFSPIIFILALLIGLPILCPVLLAFIVMMGGFFVGFGIGGVGLVAGGAALIGSAVTHISMGGGLLCVIFGGGLVLAALGILFIVFAVNCAFRAIPALFRGIRRILLALLGRRA